MASLEEATHQRRVFAWQGADTEPLTGTEADSPGAGWTISRDDVVVLIEQLRNAAGAVVAFVELQVRRVLQCDEIYSGSMGCGVFPC